METIETQRRNKIAEFIFNKRKCDNNKVTTKIIQDFLKTETLYDVDNKTILRDLKGLCEYHDALHEDQSSKPYQRPYHWWWDKNEEDLELNITLDPITAMSLLATQKFIKDMLPPIQSLNHYFNQASDELDDKSINSWITNKIEVDPLPHDVNQPEMEDGDAFQEILNALYKDKCFQADYSRSAYDLTEHGKWEAKTIYAKNHNDIIKGRIYHPLGMFRQGSVYFLVAYVTDLEMGIDRSWKPNHFAMHKFSNIVLNNDRDVDRKGFSLQEYIRTGRTHTAPNNPIHQHPENIDLEIYTSPAVGEYLYESAPHNLEVVHCRTCTGTERRGGDRDRRGWRCFKGATQDSEQLRRWILSLKDVEVLAPKELREYFKDIAAKNSAMYDESSN